MLLILKLIIVKNIYKYVYLLYGYMEVFMESVGEINFFGINKKKKCVVSIILLSINLKCFQI